ncbi:helix-turn-helix transcriptional regulator [Actinoplanes couchii]|uniref:Transcriptional regulator n=1 Tax=Actinoplanes couchii TaxID=403638 RepID=A0ABQ3X610_9ACTN|nr:helix-turn-helix transcriptional regulator [Actinoplanes couchii]MDR6325373.1 transcriptional regulator with XRE-family HTH domain [Actinoplanes couchii]GID53924.1 transcriptional regulator [Actinoplanes couchii]
MSRLGAELRAWRDRVDPAELGFARHPARRVAGLRRSELATLAGISVEYVIRLEQGRTTTPSAQVCAALARALRLSDDEQAHLMRLAGHTAGPGRVPRLIPASLLRIMEQLSGNPIGIYDATWRLLHWNPLFAATYGDPAGRPDAGQSMLIGQFEDRPSRVRQTAVERAEFEKSLVADLRASTGRYPEDPELIALVARLTRVPRFREWWELRAVAEHETASKTVEHPEVGDIDIDSNVLTTQSTDLRMVVSTARPGTDARGRLDLVATIGLQRMTVGQ